MNDNNNMNDNTLASTNPSLYNLPIENKASWWPWSDEIL
jgi:hypothetical protein